MKKRRAQLSVKTGDSLFAFLCILPAFLGVGLVVLAPIVKAIWISMTNYKLTSAAVPQWNNFANYRTLFASGEVARYFVTTLLFIFAVVSIQFLFALLVALLMNCRFLKGRNVMRALFMIPWTIPSVVTALLWSWMLHSQYGVVNWILYHLGIISDINLLWTSSPTLALPSVIIACVWRQTPYMMVMLLAGLQSVPYDLIEAGRIDGANGWQVFRNIMLPSIRPVIDHQQFPDVYHHLQHDQRRPHRQDHHLLRQRVSEGLYQLRLWSGVGAGRYLADFFGRLCLFVQALFR